MASEFGRIPGAPRTRPSHEQGSTELRSPSGYTPSHGGEVTESAARGSTAQLPDSLLRLPAGPLYLSGAPLARGERTSAPAIWSSLMIVWLRQRRRQTTRVYTGTGLTWPPYYLDSPLVCICRLRRMEHSAGLRGSVSRGGRRHASGTVRAAAVLGGDQLVVLQGEPAGDVSPLGGIGPAGIPLLRQNAPRDHAPPPAP